MRYALWMLCLSALPASADDSMQVRVTKSPVLRDAAVDSLVHGERGRGYALRLVDRIDWRFEGKSGAILRFNAVRSNRSSCLSYQLRGGTLRPLGGNERCVWVDKPHLVWSDSRAWIEFPRHITPSTRTPEVSSELTLHFDRSAGDTCFLGLPSLGFDDLMCPDGEAPTSR